jgi:Catalase
MRSAVFLSFCVALAACAETGAAYYTAVDARSYPPADGPGEKMDANEIEAAGRITAIIHAHLTRLYPNGPVLRDAHPKSTGCVDAVFTVNKDVPQAFRHGIFATPGRSYRAVIRFSNSNENPTRSDSEPDGRGMAIKLFDLGPGQIPMTSDPYASLSPRADKPPVPPDNMTLAGGPSQDFIMISHPTFLVADADGYRHVLEYADADNRLAQLMLPLASLSGMGTAGIRNANAITSLKIDNPLYTRYWSMVPYQSGTGPGALAVKFSADFVPDSEQAAAPDKSDPDFLRHAMARTLRRKEAKFIFEIQPRTSPDLSVEDSRVEWPETTAPFYPVASIVVPMQNFDTKQRDEACELLSYSPWHALPDHKPLGSVNRMRKVIYEAISAFRRRQAGDVSP